MLVSFNDLGKDIRRNVKIEVRKVLLLYSTATSIIQYEFRVTVLITNSDMGISNIKISVFIFVVYWYA